MDNPDDDFRLVVQAQQGDYRSYDALVTRHRGRIFAMIRNMIYQEADAWDLSQEVFIKAWNALPRFEAKARFTTWLYRIAVNNCKNRTEYMARRHIGRQSDVDSLAERAAWDFVAKDGGPDFDDEILQGAVVTRDGAIVHPNLKAG